VTRYEDLAAKLAARIADGTLAPGAALPSVRELAQAEDVSAMTATRAYRRLAEAGAITVEPRRTGRVTAHGALAARSLLRGTGPFRLAGSDDPALSLLIAGMDDVLVPVGASGSYHGLVALWGGRADGAAMHLRHASGAYNAPFARAVLADRDPVLVHLWRREQGIIVPPGNPRGIGAVRDLRTLRVARRPQGTGTRTLLDVTLREDGIDPDAITGPTVELHLDVALAIATGEADAGLGLRSGAARLGLGFVPLGWEPFQVATTREASGGLRPVLEALERPEVHARIAALGGYDLDGAGEVIDLR
jgi:molybdate-binding protein